MAVNETKPRLNRSYWSDWSLLRIDRCPLINTAEMASERLRFSRDLGCVSSCACVFTKKNKPGEQENRKKKKNGWNPGDKKA